MFPLVREFQGSDLHACGTSLTIALREPPRARGHHRPVLRPAVRATPVVTRDHLLSVHLRQAETDLIGGGFVLEVSAFPALRPGRVL